MTKKKKLKQDVKKFDHAEEELNGDDSGGGNVACSAEYGEELGEFAELFNHKAKLSEAARFAMAIGIQTGTRTPRKEWKGGAPRNLAHLGSTFSDNGRFDFELLFEMLGLREEGVHLNILIGEYITGGMRWIKDNELKDGTNFNQLQEEFPHLFNRND